MVLVGNKVDLLEFGVGTDIKQKFAQAKMDINAISEYFFTSAKENKYINKAFLELAQSIQRKGEQFQEFEVEFQKLFAPE